MFLAVSCIVDAVNVCRGGEHRDGAVATYTIPLGGQKRKRVGDVGND